MTLSRFIKNYRGENNLTMQQFADKAGLSKGYVSMLEKGKNPQNNRPLVPSIETIQKIAEATGTTTSELTELLDPNQPIDISHKGVTTFTIPVLGRVAAGVPIEAVEDIVDYEELASDIFKDSPKNYFGLQIKGRSMEPRICDGDYVIVHKQDDAETDDTVIALVNGNDAVCKRLKKYADSIALVSLNPAYEPMIYTKDQIDNVPVRIIGKVVELRGRL